MSRETTIVPAALMLSTAPASPTRLLTVKQWTETHAWPPPGGMRHLIFFAKANGFDAVIRRVGRRVLIDERAFFDWVARQSPGEETRPAVRQPRLSRSA